MVRSGETAANCRTGSPPGVGDDPIVADAYGIYKGCVGPFTAEVDVPVSGSCQVLARLGAVHQLVF